MCRPSCCKPPGHEGAGIAAVAVIAGAAFVSAKIGHAVAEILHTATVILTVLLLTAVAALAAILVTWTAARLIRTRQAHRQAVLRLIPSAGPQAADQTHRAPGCLACGGTGTVLRAIGTSSYHNEPCPTCQPVHRAG
jgi:hypothetical protein